MIGRTWGALALALSLAVSPLAQAQDIRVPTSGGGSFDPASPGAIGGTTPAAITGTTVSATSTAVSTAISSAGGIQAAVGGLIGFSGRSKLNSGGADGNIGLVNTSQTTQINFGLKTNTTAGYFQVGGVNAAAASGVALALSSQGCRSGSDSNCAPGNFSIQAGDSTGNATPPGILLRSPVAVASGTGAQTMTTGLVILKGVAVRTSYAVAALPACDATLTGGMAWVTDANATTYLSTVAGGGANKVPVSCDGTNWIIG